MIWIRCSCRTRRRARRLASPALLLDGGLDPVWCPRLLATAVGGAMVSPSTVHHEKAGSVGRLKMRSML